MAKRILLIPLVLTWLLSLSLVVAGQQDQREPIEKAISYGFVSPNTSEGLKLEQALKNLHAADEVRLFNDTRSVACRVRVRAQINKSLGNWVDGAENSLVFRIFSDEPTVRYAAASLGKSWRQKSVLYFRRQRSGKAHMYVFSVPRQHRPLNLVFRTVAATLDAAGVSYRTLVPLKTRVMVYVVDLSNELPAKVQKAADRLQVRPLTFAGTGGFIGNDNDRDQAQSVFAQEIKAYESKHSINNNCPTIWSTAASAVRRRFGFVEPKITRTSKAPPAVCALQNWRLNIQVESFSSRA